MEGIEMRSCRWNFACILASLVFVNITIISSMNHSVQAAEVSLDAPLKPTDIDLLIQTRTKAKTLLDKIEIGADPCFTDECQVKKSRFLSKIFAQSQKIPGAGISFLKARDSGIASGRQLVRHRFTPPKLENGYFPQSVKEWVVWWQRRYSYEMDMKSTWQEFGSQAYSMRAGLQLYARLASESDEKKQIIQEAWDRGLADAARFISDGERWIIMAAKAEDAGRMEEAAKYREMAHDSIKKKYEIESRFEGQLYAVIDALFPNSTRIQTMAFLILIDEWKKMLDEPRLFSPSFQEKLKFQAEQVGDLTSLIADFNDLEYGVVGIRNFHSPVNPAVLAEMEIPIQEFLDSVDFSGRASARILSFYLMTLTADSLIGSSAAIRFGLPAVIDLQLQNSDQDIAQVLWPASHQTQKIKSALDTLEKRMENRRQELFRSQKIIRQKIEELDEKIRALKEEETHDENP